MFFVAQSSYVGYKIVRQLPNVVRAIDFAQDLARNAVDATGRPFSYLVGDTDGNTYAMAYADGTVIYCGQQIDEGEAAEAYVNQKEERRLRS